MLGWASATAVFAALVTLLGGFSGDDTFETIFSTWAIAHGQFACAFPEAYRVTAPLYPLLSGGVASLAHIGNTLPFPTRQAMGPYCDRSFLAINTWSLKAGVTASTVKMGYLGWLGLMGGAIALLRAAGRGLRRWEPTTLILLAFLPPVWTCVQSTFHPEDLLAMGFALGAVASALRSSWVGAGILIGLAVLSQQFTLLAGVPLFVLAPRHRRFAFGEAAAITVAIVAAPLMITSSGRAAHAIIFGTGDTGGVGGTALWELGPHGAPLLLLTRIFPLALTAVLAYWVGRRLGPVALEPVPLVALVAVSLSIRLVFEQNFFEYYLMALCVTLVLLDVVRGHLRATLLAWLVIVPVVYLDMIELPDGLARVVPAVAIVLAVLALAVTRRNGSRGRYAPWLAVVATALFMWNPERFDHLPTWFCQVAVVVPGVVLAAGPLLAEVRRHAKAATSPLVKWEPRAEWRLVSGPRITVPAHQLPVHRDH